MQITADVSEIWKTVRADLIFILNLFSESNIHSDYFSIVLAKKNVLYKMVFNENKAAYYAQLYGKVQGRLQL